MMETIDSVYYEGQRQASLSICLGAANNDTPTPSPTRIFPLDSPVYDYADGNLDAAQEQYYLSEMDTSLAMYYAHWDGTSLQVAVEFDQLARQMIGQALFVAVNCWWPFGKCRQKIQTPYYPVLIAHYSQYEGIQYKGILTAPEISRFLRRVAAPFIYVSDIELLNRLHALEDTLVIGHFYFGQYEENADPPGLASFHRAALLSLGKDSIDHVQYGIITNPNLARMVNLTDSQSLVLVRMLKEPLYYPPKRKFSAKFIMHWVFDNREQLVQWIVPTGVKSLIMSKQLQDKPALILLTSHNHNNSFHNDVHLLRILAMDYYNCNKSTQIYHLIQRIEKERLKIADNLARTHNTEQCCQTVATTKLARIKDIPWGRQNVCEVCEQFTQPLKVHLDPLLLQNCHSAVLSTAIHNFAMSPNSCLHVDNYYSPYSHFELCCKLQPLCGHKYYCNPDRTIHTKHLKSVDPLILRSSHFCKECQQVCASKYLNGPNDCENDYKDIHYNNRTRGETFTGLGCRTNKSVSFLALRIDLYDEFAERLGIPSHLSDSGYPKTSLALIDIKNEMQYILPMTDKLLTSDVQELLINFTRANLSRHLRSSHTQQPNVVGEDTHPDDNSTTYTVQEVVSDTFETVVLRSKQNVLLLYYASWCGFCAQLHHIYHTLARFLHDTSNLIIARINGDLNDLPWEFSVPEYPTLLLFPASKKENSIRYPEHLPYNIPNLLQFVLENLQ